MKDMNGILREYVPLQLITVGAVYGNENTNPDAYLSEYDFCWQPIVDSKYKPQLFFGTEKVSLEPEGKDRKTLINERTGGKPLRMPKISFCWGDQSLLIANEMIDQIEFNDNLGITCSDAELFDAAGHQHHDFRVLSFHKTLFHERFEQRFAEVPVSKRLLVSLKLLSNRSTLFVHKSLIEQWQKIGVSDVNYDIKEEHLTMDVLVSLECYSANHSQRDYFDIEDFQNNRNGHIDTI